MGIITNDKVRKRRWIRQPRKRFNLSDLEDGSVYYNTSISLFYAQCYYYTDTDSPMFQKLNMGWNYYDSILDNVKALNRCFQKLIKESEYSAALPLLRLQMDNLCVIYAESIYPEKVLPYILEKGRNLGQIKINGEYLKASVLLDKLDSQYNKLKEIWSESCGYVHPSKAREEASKTHIYKKEIRRYVKDVAKEKKYLLQMVFINQVILDILNSELNSYIFKLKEKGTYKEYYKTMQIML